MGPESTDELLLRITHATPIHVEQEHLRVLIDSNPQIPNRTEALLSGETGPVIKALSETARNLQRSGAEVLGIPCNTAHAFLADAVRAVDVPVVDMIGETAGAARDRFGVGSTVGLLATDGTIRTKLHYDALAGVGVGCQPPPSPDIQRRLMQALDDVKRRGVSADAARSLTAALGDILASGRVAGVISGCTEVSLVLERYPPELPWIDPLQVLAEALVREATTDDDP